MSIENEKLISEPTSGVSVEQSKTLIKYELDIDEQQTQENVILCTSERIPQTVDQVREQAQEKQIFNYYSPRTKKVAKSPKERMREYRRRVKARKALNKLNQLSSNESSIHNVAERSSKTTIDLCDADKIVNIEHIYHLSSIPSNSHMSELEYNGNSNKNQAQSIPKIANNCKNNKNSNVVYIWQSNKSINTTIGQSKVISFGVNAEKKSSNEFPSGSSLNQNVCEVIFEKKIGQERTEDNTINNSVTSNQLKPAVVKSPRIQEFGKQIKASISDVNAESKSTNESLGQGIADQDASGVCEKTIDRGQSQRNKKSCDIVVKTKKIPKTSAERVRDHRQRQKILRDMIRGPLNDPLSNETFNDSIVSQDNFDQHNSNLVNNHCDIFVNSNGKSDQNNYAMPNENMIRKKNTTSMMQNPFEGNSLTNKSSTDDCVIGRESPPLNIIDESPFFFVAIDG